MMTDDPKYTVFEKAPLDKYLDRNVVFYCPNCGYKMQTPYDMSQIKLPDLEVPSIIKNECAFTPNFTIPCPDCKNGYLVDIDAGMVEIIRTLSWDLLDKPIKTTACCAGHVYKNGVTIEINRLVRARIEISTPYIQFAPGMSPLDTDLNILPWMHTNGYWVFEQVEFFENDTDEHPAFYTPKDRGVAIRFNHEIIDDILDKYSDSYDVGGATNDILNHFTEARVSLLSYIREVMVPRWNHDAIRRKDPRFDKY